MEPPKSHERRTRTRVTFHGQAELWVDDIFLPVAFLKDISLNGLFVVTGAIVPLGRDCEVIIRLGPDEDQVLRINGRISRQEETGLGVEFLSMDPDSFDHLRKIVLYNSPDPDQIENELTRAGLRPKGK